jgi:predicted Zn-dependent protease
LSREEAKALADRVLALSSADQTRVNITTQWSGNTRFADGSITTSGSVTNTTVTVTVTAGKRQASASTNVLDEASLKRTVDLAARLAQLAPEDPELMPELEPQTYTAVNGFSQETAELDAESRAAAIRRAVTAATSAGNAAGQMFTAGYLRPTRVVAVATSRGLFATTAPRTPISMTARTPDGSGSGWHGRP